MPKLADFQRPSVMERSGEPGVFFGQPVNPTTVFFQVGGIWRRRATQDLTSRLIHAGLYPCVQDTFAWGVKGKPT